MLAFEVDETEVGESPYEFVAMTRATTSDELINEKGAALSTETGIVHCLAETIAPFEPLQFVLSCCQVKSAA
jgi:hypothetical protein